jgi:hypothetical protein
MRIVYERCCGLDVQKKSIMACLLAPDERAGTRQEVRRFPPCSKLSNLVAILAPTTSIAETPSNSSVPSFADLRALVSM